MFVGQFFVSRMTLVQIFVGEIIIDQKTLSQMSNRSNVIWPIVFQQNVSRRNISRRNVSRRNNYRAKDIEPPN
jgi:hypothetical protein